LLDESKVPTANDSVYGSFCEYDDSFGRNGIAN
jgi:hypothetical protein